MREGRKFAQGGKELEDIHALSATALLHLETNRVRPFMSDSASPSPRQAKEIISTHDRSNIDIYSMSIHGGASALMSMIIMSELANTRPKLGAPASRGWKDMCYSSCRGPNDRRVIVSHCRVLCVR